MSKIIIAGSRTFTDYNKLKEVCDKVLKGTEITEIVSGTATGADKLGEQYALENNIPIKQFLPDWDKYGKSAGFLRNEEMAKYADILVAFWDGESKGTGHMIDLANKYKLKHIIFHTND